ncbi:MAG: hypothetical protein LAP85_20320 [Acidobacteriia bacterium]|nr:hypothetical protein [Terriglobia bacterium]
MAESKLITFTMPEMAEILVKQQNIREGFWGIYVKFGIGAGNVPGAPEESSPKRINLLPAAIVPVLELGIQRFDSANSMTIDAAKVNPAVRKTRIRKRGA